MSDKLRVLLVGIIIVCTATMVMLTGWLRHHVVRASSQTEILFERALTESYSDLAQLLLVYSAYDQDGIIKLLRHGRDGDGGYAVPEKAFKAADVLLGYGIAKDNSFEDSFSEIYNKPSYGFDCGIDSIASKSKLFTFVNQCIATDDTLNYPITSSNKVSSLTQQLEQFKLKDKKIFIKMDIEGAEYKALENIFQHQSSITGIVMEIHLFSDFDVFRAVKLLNHLNKDFILLSVHGNNCLKTFFTTDNATGRIPKLLELTYINKSLVNGYNISKNQTHPTTMDMPNCPWDVFEFTILSNK